MARRELVVAIVSDASQFSRGFNKAKRDVDGFSKSVDNASKSGLGKVTARVSAVTASLEGLAAAGGVALVASQLVNFAKDSLKAFSDLNESINAVQVSFGDAADGVLALGENAAESMGLANSEFNSLAVSFSAFTRAVAQGSGQTVTAVLEELTQRAADFASVMNIDVNDAAEKFRSGLAGETEPLRRFGIDLSAAKVNARALADGLAASTGEITEQDKIVARYRELMDQTSQTQGDFANTSDELANKQRILAAKLKDVQAEVGKKLADPMASVLNLAEDLLPIIEGLGDAFGLAAENISVFANLITDLGDLFPQTESDAEDAGNAMDFVATVFRAIHDAGNPIFPLLRGLHASWDDFIAFLNRNAGPSTEMMVEHMQSLEGELDAIHGSAPAAAEAIGEVASTVSAADFSKNNTNRLIEQLEAAESAARNTRIAILELTSPAFAAIKAREREAAAEEALQDARAKGDVDGIRRAEADLAEARISSFVALEKFDATGVAGQVRTIADALGITFLEAQNLLSALGILQGTSLDIPIVFTLTTVGTPPPLNEIINGRPGGGAPSFGAFPSTLPTPVPQPTSNVTSQIINNNITIEGNTTSRTASDIQRELTLNSVARWSEIN